MKDLLSLLFGIGALCFVVFFANFKPDAFAAVIGPSKPVHCSTKPSVGFACRSHVFAAALWPEVGIAK